MSDKTDDKAELTTNILLTDIMLRLSAMEKLMIDKGIMTREEYSEATKVLAEKVNKIIKEKAEAVSLSKSN
jgi:hypothetical protein